MFSCQKEDISPSFTYPDLCKLTISELEPHAQDGDALAQYQLAILYAREKESDSEQKAFYWFTKAAQHLTEARFMLGRLYEQRGEREKAFYWYSKATDVEGNIPAQLKLIQYYEEGLGVVKSINSAAQCSQVVSQTIPYESFDKEFKELSEYALVNGLSKAAYYCVIDNKLEAACDLYLKALKKNANHIQSLVGLGYVYESLGQFDHAKEYYEKAAEVDSPQAFFKLGFFATKEGEYEKAIYFLSRAAKLNHLEAQYLIGFMIEHGQGFEQDVNLAYETYQTVGAQGHEEALALLESKAENDAVICYKLGRLYENGINGVPDIKKANFFYKKGTSKNNLESYSALNQLNRKYEAQLLKAAQEEREMKFRRY